MKKINGKPVNTLEEQKKIWLEEFNNSTEITNYLAGFEPASVASFMEQYLTEKYIWFLNTEWDVHMNELEQLRYSDQAFKQLGYILQKKLFDMQCLWRAEKIQIEGVTICYDFNYWEHDIMNCPFLELLTESDIDMYALYLQSNNAELEIHFLAEWQDYTSLKEAYITEGENRNFPEWYEYNNSLTGLSSLLLLPDIRGDKEAVYLDANKAENIRLHPEWAQQEEEDEFDDDEEEDEDEEYEDDDSDNDETAGFNAEEEKDAAKNNTTAGETNAAQDASASLPKLVFRKDFTGIFVNKFESNEVKHVYGAYTWLRRNSYKHMEMSEMIDELQEYEEFIPIEAHYDWRIAIERALRRHKCKKIAAALPTVLEQYLMRKQMGITFEANNIGMAKSTRDMVEGYILNGRRLCGEPDDLNF